MKPTSSRIAQTFADLRRQDRLALMPFIPAGYPDLATTAAVLLAAQEAGASLIEVGIPFSDPIADGPVIQAAFTKSLEHKLKVADVFEAVASIRDRLTIPLVAMVSFSIVFKYGLDRFLSDARRAGFDGLILPDLPPPEAKAICEKVWAAGLDTILLVAPTTEPARRHEIVALTSGFVYYLSVSGITGERTTLPADLAENLTELRTQTDLPLCVGFGISKPSHIKQLRGFAQGAIVGSAVVRKMTESVDQGTSVIADSVKRYCQQLLSETG
jgi:tryptophan synthase alpha chain